MRTRSTPPPLLLLLALAQWQLQCCLVSGEAREVRSLLSGKCMQVPFASQDDGAGVTQFSCRDEDHFLFDTVPVGPGSYFQLRAKHSGKCVGVRAGSHASGARVVQEPCAAADSQMWRIRMSGDLGPGRERERERRQLVVKHSAYCLNVAFMNPGDEAPLEVWPCADGALSNFWDVRFRPPSQPLPSEYVNLVNVNSGRCAEMAFGSRDSGRPLTQYACYDDDHYQLSLQPVEGMFYHIQFRHSGKCVGVAADSQQDGALVAQDDCDPLRPRPSQLWQIMELSGQGFLVNKHSGLCMSVRASSTANAARVVQAACDATMPSNLWRFETVDTKMHVEPLVGSYVSIRSKASDRCAEMPFASLRDDAQLGQYSCQNRDHFQYVIRPRGDYYQLQFKHSNKCVDVRANSTLDGVPVVQNTCNDTDASQLWMVRGPPTAHQLVAKHSQKCFNLKDGFTRNGAKIIQEECTTASENSWTFEERARMRNADHLLGKYVTIANERSGRCAEMPFASEESNAGVSQYSCYEQAHHFQFRFISDKDGDDYYNIRMRHSDKCVDVRDRSNAADARIVQETCQYQVDSQLWYVRGPSDKLQIVNKHSGMCMYATFGNNGADVIQYPCLDTSSAKWILKQVDVVPTRTPNSFDIEGNVGWQGPYSMSIVAVAVANLADGRILTWSAYGRMNYGGNGMQTWTSIFDPSTNESTEALIEDTDHDMFCPGTAVLPDGRIAITGGSRSSAFTLYDPSMNFWYRGPDMTIKRGYHSMTMLADGRVFTLGGSWSGAKGGKDGEIWDPTTNEWEHKKNIQADGTLLTKDSEGIFRSDNHMWLFTAPNGKVFHAGPSTQMHWLTMDGNGTVVESEIRDVSDAMNGNAVMFDIGKILTIGGAPDYTDSNAVNRAHIIDLNDGDQVTVTRTGSLHTSRVFHDSVVLPSGEVVSVGGQQRARIFKDDLAVMNAEIWNPLTGLWSTLPGMAIPRTYHSTAILMKDGRVWSGGGGLCGTCSVNHFNSEILTPPYLLDQSGSLISDRPIIINATESAGAGDIIQVEMDTNDEHTFALVRLAAATHSTNNDGRRFPLDVVSQTGSAFDLQIPANKAVALAGSYFLFAMDGDGVPSVATILKLDVPLIMDMFPSSPL